MRTRTKVQALIAVLVIAGIALVPLYEWKLVRDRQSADEFAAELAAELPVGSSEKLIISYIEAHGYSHETFITRQPTETIDAPGGTTVIRADTTVSGTLFTSAKERTIFFVLSSDNRLERTIVRDEDVI